MTKFKGFIKRSTYIITSLILVLSLVFPMLVSAAQLESEETSNDTGVIQEFKTSFLRGGDEVKIGGEEKSITYGKRTTLPRDINLHSI